MPKSIQVLVLTAILALLLAGCATGGAATETAAGGPDLPDLALTSPAFQSGAAIPAVYSCKGEDISPPLAWQAPPEGTQSLALIMDDPDAPVGTWVHWVVYNLPPTTGELPEAAARAKAPGMLPKGAAHGSNSWKRADYGGPCPPSGQHRYFFRLYALDTTLPGEGLDKAALLKAIEGHILARGEWMGTFGEP